MVIEPQSALHANDDISYVSIDDMDDAVASSVDGIVIATPTGLHHDHAIAVADRGWYILIESPFAQPCKKPPRWRNILRAKFVVWLAITGAIMTVSAC